MIKTLVKTPALDEIYISKWFNAKYNLAQLEEIETLIAKEVWITHQKIKIPVREMSTYHIKNCIRCWHGKGKLKIPSGYLGGKEKWLKIFVGELIKRS